MKLKILDSKQEKRPGFNLFHSIMVDGERKSFENVVTRVK